MIERIHLEILREIDRKGSLTAAAEDLHLTQSALSHTVKKLEQRLGVSLWLKEGRSIRLTQAGEFLLREAKRLLPQLEYVEDSLKMFASGEQGILRIGMECHPCYQWLLKQVSHFLKRWPKVDVDVRQKFQFGGMAALFNHDIDILVTPDPLEKEGVEFTAVFPYEQVLVVSDSHKFSGRPYIEAADLRSEILFTYPVDAERLDIYSEFLLPANVLPQKRKTLEATEMILQMVAAGRGVAALPKWLVDEFQAELPISAVRLGKSGIAKQIFLGIRTGETEYSPPQRFLELVREL